MSDDWERYDRELADYLRRLDWFQQRGKQVGAKIPPRPPIPPSVRRAPRTFAGWPTVARGLSREEVWEAYDKLKPKRDRRPTRTAVAGDLGVHESTLERAQKDLGIGGWPPPRQPPER